MERCVQYENAVLTDRARRAEADFEAPEGVDEATAAKLREEAGKRALFDASPRGDPGAQVRWPAPNEASSAASRSCALMNAPSPRITPKKSWPNWVRFCRGEMTDQEFDKLAAEEETPLDRKPRAAKVSGGLGDLGKRFEVPIAIGKPG